MEPVSMGTLAALGAISAGGSIIGGLISGDAQRDAARINAQAQYANMKRLDDAYKELSPYYQQIIDQLPIKDRISALQEWTGVSMEDYGTFDPSQDVNAWLDPSIAYQQEQAQRSIQASQAARGGMNSGGALKELQDRAQNIGQAGWNTAAQQSYGDYTNRFNAYRQKNADEYTNLSNLANMSINAQGSLANLKTGNVVAQNQANTMAAGYQANANTVMQNTMGQALSGLTSPQNVGAFYQALQAPSQPQLMGGYSPTAYGEGSFGNEFTNVPQAQQLMMGLNPAMPTSWNVNKGGV